MNEFLKADIFFFVTTVAVVALSAVGITVLFYLIRILKNLRAVTEIAKKMAELFHEDTLKVREKFKENANASGAAKIIGALFDRARRAKRKVKK